MATKTGMPAPLAVDREAVKAHAITHGIREAARAFDLRENTVKSWAKREGWLDPARAPIVHPRPLPLSIRPKVRAPDAPTPSQAARNSMSNMLLRTRQNMARTADKGFAGAVRMHPEDIISVAPGLKALAGVAQVAHPELREDSRSGPLVSFTFHAGCPMPESIELPDGPPTLDVAP